MAKTNKVADVDMDTVNTKNREKPPKQKPKKAPVKQPGKNTISPERKARRIRNKKHELRVHLNSMGYKPTFASGGTR